MRMLIRFQRFSLVIASAALVLLAASGAANAVARTPTISGNSWVAVAIIGVLVATIYMLIMGALHIERRDASLGRRSRDRDNAGWFGFFPHGGDGGDDGGDGGHGH